MKRAVPQDRSSADHTTGTARAARPQDRSSADDTTGTVQAARPPDFSSAMAQAYDATAAAWATGPGRVYNRLATVLVARSPVPLASRTVLDLGAGTGAASRAILEAGGRPVALDRSARMLLADAATRRRALVGDAVALPLPDHSIDGVVAAFSLNHLPDPAAGLAEARRVCRPGSPVLAASYAGDDDHPVKAAVERASVEAGWAPDAWYEELRSTVLTQLASPEGMAEAARRAGLDGAAERVTVELADLTPGDLVAWRMGMAQIAPFLAGLDAAARQRVVERARRLLGDDAPPLRRALVVFAGVA